VASGQNASEIGHVLSRIFLVFFLCFSRLGTKNNVEDGKRSRRGKSTLQALLLRRYWLVGVCGLHRFLFLLCFRFDGSFSPQHVDGGIDQQL